MSKCPKCDGSGLRSNIRSYCGCKTAKECMNIVTICLTKEEASALYESPMSFELAVIVHNALTRAGVHKPKKP